MKRSCNIPLEMTFLSDGNIIVADNLCVKTDKGINIPLYFNNPKYFLHDTVVMSIHIDDENFLKECLTVAKDKILPTYRCCSFNENRKDKSNVSDWYKLDSLIIPIENLIDLTRLVLRTESTGKEQSLASLIYKCNMTGTYRVADDGNGEIARIYSFNLVQQYRKMDREFITVVSFIYLKYTYSTELDCIKLLGYTSENYNDTQELLASKLKDYKPIKFD
jgi:hypothetical protein